MDACPTCHRPFGSKGRYCLACKRPIKRHHKWHIVGCYIVHDDCQNPTLAARAKPDDAPLLNAANGGPHETEEKNPAAL